jgi:hypothetical protein
MFLTRKEIQIKFYTATATPTLKYGSVIWTIRKKNQEAKVETTEMKFLKNVAGYIGKDQIRSTKIREELNIFNLNAKVIKSKSTWLYHVQRMEEKRIPKKVPSYNRKRKRNMGCSPLRWRDQHTL